MQPKSCCNLRLGPALEPAQLAGIRRHLHLHCNKWDTQVGDVSVICRQALVLPEGEWTWLCSAAEQLAIETKRAETILLDGAREDLRLGMPRAIWKAVLSPRAAPDRLSALTRAMRFDFHPTKDRWRVSEVNSDVPGGWTEASMLPVLFHPFYAGMQIPASPLEAWSSSMKRTANGGRVALLSAPGFLEDQQVIFAFMRSLEAHDTPCSAIQSPSALDWSAGGTCRLRGTSQQISAIVRFFQMEWLCRLPEDSGWKELLQTQTTPVMNPTVSALSESKRFPLTFDDPSSFPFWQKLVPHCRDPRDVASSDWNDWVLKKAYSNTGDEVHICGELGKRHLRTLLRRVLKEPLNWVAQRRFETLAVESDDGPLFPCVGVYVVNGRAAGAYVRLSRGQITNGMARESAMFIESANGKG